MTNHPAVAANRVAVVTGAASGIGLAAATRFAVLGMKVCMADANAKGLQNSLGMSTSSADLVAGQETTHTLNAMALQGNISQDKAAAQYGAMHDMTPAQASQVLASMPNNPMGSNAAWVGQPGANGAIDPSQLGGHAMPAGTSGGPVMPGTSTAAPSSLPPGLTGFRSEDVV